MENFYSSGVTDVAIVTGYKRELTCTIGTTEFYNPNWATTQMVSSLECANEWLEAHDCIVSYSDIFYENSAIISLIEKSAEISITFDPNWLSLWEQRFENPLSDAESFKINLSGEVSEIGARVHSIENIQGQFMGLVKYTPAGWRKVQALRASNSKPENDKQDMTSLLNQLIKTKATSIMAVPYYGVWGETDSEKDLEICERIAKS